MPRTKTGFHGTYEHSLDSKHRVTIPSKFRSELGKKVFIVRGQDRCASVYPESRYVRLITEGLINTIPLSLEMREAKRQYFGCALDTEVDCAGRLAIPVEYLHYADIDKRVLISGIGDCLELWSPKHWPHPWDWNWPTREERVHA